MWSQQRKPNGWCLFVSAAERAFYHQSLDPDLANQSRQFTNGFIVKADSSIALGKVKLETNDKAQAFFKKVLALPSTQDRWITHHRNRKIQSYGEYLGYAIAAIMLSRLILSVTPVLS